MGAMMTSCDSVKKSPTDSQYTVKVVSGSEDGKEDTMQNQKPNNLPLFEKVLAGSCVAALGTSLASESAFTMSILAVTLPAILALFQEVLW